MRMKQLLSGLIVACVLLVSSGIATVTLQEPDGVTPGSWDGGLQFILTSDGATYPVNESGLQDSLNSVNGTMNGTVWIATGSDIELSSTINVWHNTTLDVQGTTFTLLGDFDGIHVYPLATLTSTSGVGVIDTTINNYDSSAIRIMPYWEGGGNPAFQRSPTSSIRRTTVKHFSLISANGNGTGLHLYADTADRVIGFSYVDDIYVKYFENGIRC